MILLTVLLVRKSIKSYRSIIARHSIFYPVSILFPNCYRLQLLIGANF